MKPEELRFTKTHEWVAAAEEDGAKVATIGLSTFAIEALTDLVFIELPQVGREVHAEESICEVESVKAVSDIYAPVAGKIVAVNDALPNNLETLSSDPYGSGWIAKIEISDESQLNRLLDYEAYRKQCEEEAKPE